MRRTIQIKRERALLDAKRIERARRIKEENRITKGIISAVKNQPSADGAHQLLDMYVFARVLCPPCRTSVLAALPRRAAALSCPCAVSATERERDRSHTTQRPRCDIVVQVANPHQKQPVHTPHTLPHPRSLFVSRACHVQAKRGEGPARLHAGQNSARGGQRRGVLRHSSLHGLTRAREGRDGVCLREREGRDGVCFFGTDLLTVTSASITGVLGRALAESCGASARTLTT
jgi:hypothetical protein